MAPVPLQVPYATIISTLAFAGSVIYGIWALNQAQLANVGMQINQLRKDADAKADRLSAELVRRETELRADIDNVQEQLRARRAEFVSQSEFRQFQDRVLDDVKVLRGQVSILEQTRPTTGELQATTAALRDRIDKLYGLIAAQEDWMRRMHGGAPPIPKPQ